MDSQIKDLFDSARENNSPLLLDGSMGALLSQMGFNWHPTRWMTDVIEESPETIRDIHKQYLKAGADIITTHTFRTNPSSIGNDESKLFVKKATELAKEAKTNTKTLIAGSNPPAEDCYQTNRNLSYKLLENNHHNHIDYLIDNGTDFILNETQSHKDEIELICNFCSKNDIPFVLSLYFTENLSILSGESMLEILNYIGEHNPLAVGFNCIPLELFERFMNNYEPDNNWGFYLNCGAGAPSDRHIKCGVTPENYGTYAASYMDLKPTFIGACCGSSPKHIEVLRNRIYG